MVESTTWVTGKDIKYRQSLCNFVEAVELLLPADKDGGADYSLTVLHRLLLGFLQRLQ